MNTSTRAHRNGRYPVIKPDLASFLWPHTPSEFFEKYWQKEVFVSHGPVSRLKRLLTHFRVKPEFGVEDLRMLARRSSVTQGLAGQTTPQGDFRIFNTPIDSALELYRCGFLLYFHLNDSTSLAWRARFASDLGINKAGGSSILAGIKSASAPLHFDMNEDFTIQLRGVNRWWIAPQPDVFRPRQNWVPTLVPFPKDLRSCTESEPALPTRASMKQFELRPGSVLYVPRGYWHATERQDATLALNFAFNPYDCVDLVLDSLRSALVSIPEWRTVPEGAFSDLKNRRGAHQQIRGLLGKLSKSLPLLADDLFPEVDSPTRPLNGTYRKNALSSFYVEEKVGRSGVYSVTFDHAGVDPKRSGMYLSKDLIAVCRWINRKGEPFELKELGTVFAGLGMKRLRELVGLLVKARFVQGRILRS